MKLILSGLGLILFGFLLPSPRTDIPVPPGSDLNVILRTAAPGSTFVLADGTYAPVRVSERNGTALAQITLRAEHQGMAIISGFTPTLQNAYTNFKCSWWVFDGLVFEKAQASGMNIGSFSDHLVFRHCTFRNNGIMGMLTGTSNDGLIEDCEFYGQLGPTAQHALYLSSKPKNWVIRRCQFYKNQMAGLQMNSQGTGGVITNMTVENCSFWSNGEGNAAAALNLIGVTNSVFSGLSLSDNKAGGFVFSANGSVGGESVGNIVNGCSITFRPGEGRTCIQQTKGQLSVTNTRMWTGKPSTVVDAISVLAGAVVTQSGNTILTPPPPVAVTPDPGPIVP